MSSPTTTTKEMSAIRPHQKFEGHTSWIRGAIYLLEGQRIMTCSEDGSLRVWNLDSGKQIGEDWRDGDGKVWSIALSPDGKKVVSGSSDGGVRLWEIETGKVIAKWTGHTGSVWSVCWSRDGQQVVSGSSDGTVRQWDVESEETILAPGQIKTGHVRVIAVVYSPDTTMIATGGLDRPWTEDKYESSIEIWDAKTGELVATLKGHTSSVRSLAWTADGKTLISGSYDHSIRTWNAKIWKQTAVLDVHTSVYGIVISPNGRILASASADWTARLWNLDNGQPISSPLQHAGAVTCLSFSADGKLLATGSVNHAYTWDSATIIREAGLDELLSDPKAKKSARHENATRHPTQQRQPAHRVPPGFFDDPPERSHFSPRSRLHSSAPQGSILLSRLFNSTHSDAHHTSSPLDWAQNLLKRRGQSGEDIELHERSPAVVEVPCAKGKRRNASAREKRKTKPLRTTMASSRPPKPNATHQSTTQTQPSSQPQAPVSDSPTTPAVNDTAAASTSTTLHPHATIRHAGLWTRFWLFICCLSPEYTDGRH